jgi:hypothetical protein
MTVPYSLQSLSTRFLIAGNMAVNGDFQTDFDVDESSEAILRIQHKGDPNREKATAQMIGTASFAAKLSRVQYGTYRGQEAVLLAFSFEFGFLNESVKRMTSATLKIILEEAKDNSVEYPDPRNPNNDPKIVAFGPSQICGEMTTVNNTRTWALDFLVQFQALGLETGPEASYETQISSTRDHRMWINGKTESDDDHDDDNIVSWNIQENKIQKSGVPHRLLAFIIATLPQGPKTMVKVTARIRPYVAFTINPLRLLQKRDDPILLDRLTAKGDTIAPGVDFTDKDFPLNSLIQALTEYNVSLLETITRSGY